MAGTTSIEWTDVSWNPVVGCTRVSKGCDQCYAFTLHDRRHIAWKRGRWDSAPQQYYQPFSRVQLLPQRLADPLHWRTPRRVFVNSMSDLFHKDVPDEYIEQVFGVMALTPQHTYQILTKRPERMRGWMLTHNHETVAAAVCAWGPGFTPPAVGTRTSRRIIEQIGAGWPWPLPNVWIGTSVEDQEAAKGRIPILLQTPAAVRFLSCEPLLSNITLYMLPGLFYTAEHEPVRSMLSQIDWCIIGGESGARARPLALESVESLIRQCRAAGTAVFVKQLGTRWAQAHGAHDRHGGEPSEWPEHLRVREFPYGDRKEARA